MNTKEIERWVDRVLRSRGFDKNKRDWYRKTSECIVLAAVEKSPYGGQYYLNLGASPKDLLKAEIPREYQCHVRVRLHDLMPDGDRLRRALDLEDSTVDPSTRELVIVEALTLHGVPVLEALGSMAGLRALLIEHQSAAAFRIRSELNDYMRREINS